MAGRRTFRVTTDTLAAKTELSGLHILKVNPLPPATPLSLIIGLSMATCFGLFTYITLEKTRVSGMLHHIELKWLPQRKLSRRYGLTCHTTLFSSTSL